MAAYVSGRFSYTGYLPELSRHLGMTFMYPISTGTPPLLVCSATALVVFRALAVTYHSLGDYAQTPADSRGD